VQRIGPAICLWLFIHSCVAIRSKYVLRVSDWGFKFTGGRWTALAILRLRAGATCFVNLSTLPPGPWVHRRVFRGCGTGSKLIGVFE